jgi:hypothetical protein
MNGVPRKVWIAVPIVSNRKHTAIPAMASVGKCRQPPARPSSDRKSRRTKTIDRLPGNVLKESAGPPDILIETFAT